MNNSFASGSYAARHQERSRRRPNSLGLGQGGDIYHILSAYKIFNILLPKEWRDKDYQNWEIDRADLEVEFENNLKDRPGHRKLISF